MSKMLYQGHGSYRFTLDDGKIVYVDPFAGEGYDLSPDAVLVTHEHSDHNKLSLLNLRKDTVVIRAAQALKDGKYNSFDLGYMQVRAVPASNANHDIKECVGYILSFDGLKIYCAGDTSFLPFMEEELPEEKLDYAILPGDGVYNMDIKEASYCASCIKARHTIPVHLFPGQLYSETIAGEFKCSSALLVRPGEEIEL